MLNKMTATVLFALAATVTDASDLPNVVVVMADDLGYGDVQALNPDSRIPTPNMDRLASMGTRFTDAHSPSAVCTPTRYGLIMGRYCWRTRLTKGVQDGYGPPLVEHDRQTLAEAMKAKGYATAIVGKWHLGLEFAHGADGENDYTKPLSDGAHSHGFDYSYIIPASLDFPPYVYIRDGAITAPVETRHPATPFPRFLREGPIASDFDMEGCLDRLTEEAAGYIATAAKKDKPFFLYYPLTAPHKPVWPAERFRGESGLGPYGDFILQVDHTVGEILDAIEASGERDNTLLIFTSDNGSYMHSRDPSTGDDHVDDESIQAYRSDRHRSNYIYRGTKADIWEAGHRVPFFVAWPGHVPVGAESRRTITHTDIYATLMELTGNQDDTYHAQDGFSFYKSMLGKKDEPRPLVVNHSANGTFAIREGAWKLILSSGSGGREKPRGEPFDGGYGLYNLGDDAAETNNRADAEPDRVKTMEAALNAIRESE
jgi:arylsulfatase A-like enzyme